MSDLPETIKHPSAFGESPASGFDGIFDWSWTQGCFGAGKITPMDFDGVVERKGNFIIFETKGVGVPVPRGQLITLRKAHALDVFTVMLIQGKARPEYAQCWCPPDFKAGSVMTDFCPITTERAAGFVADWYEYADKNPKQKIDVSLLNKRISAISDERDNLANRIVAATSLLNKAIEILAE